MPTGSDKSAIYQLAGLLHRGLTIIVSPLIALQRDQVDAFDAAGLSAAHLNSTLGERERDDLLARIDAGDLTFLFLAPEQLANDETVRRLHDAKPALFVDEAHCITDWGHDFRPDYLQLGPVIARLDHPTVLALTATAAGPVRDEIVSRLGMRDPAIFVQGFDRPNIYPGVETFRDEDDKRAALLERARAHAGPGIVYAATRQATEEIAAALVEAVRSAAAYHAGLKALERNEVQARFMDNEIEIMVATIAFGMGIDKPDIRFVFHHDISESLDAYYQEIGRAGRDGEPAKAILFYLPDDLDLRRFQSGVGGLKVEDVRPVLATIQDAGEAVDPADLREEPHVRDSQIARALHRLEEVGAITIQPSGEVEAVETERSVADAATAAAAAQDHLRQYAATRLEMMRQYAETTDCRRPPRIPAELLRRALRGSLRQPRHLPGRHSGGRAARRRALPPTKRRRSRHLGRRHGDARRRGQGRRPLPRRRLPDPRPRPRPAGASAPPRRMRVFSVEDLVRDIASSTAEGWYG